MLIALTTGEPAGIGSELTVKLATQPLPITPIVIGDPNLIEHFSKLLGISLDLVLYDPDKPPNAHIPNTLVIHPVDLGAPNMPGKLNTKNVPYVLETLRIATTLCLEKKVSAMITNPVHKGIINQAGIPFRGQTETIGKLCNTAKTVMMLANDTLRVALATTHIPLAKVAKAITKDTLFQVIQTVHHDLISLFGVAKPRIIVCGLNPHAGEGGEIGTEEITIIKPCIEQLQHAGIDVKGPISADTIFTPQWLNQADVVIAMYHDQGLPVLKYQGFGKSVNISLGLPIIRTSVDHGTALDIAGKNSASMDSLLATVSLTKQLVINKNG